MAGAVYPQVLLLGNGLNRAYDGDTWAEMVDNLHSNPRVAKASIKQMPFPLQIIAATGDQVEHTIKEHKETFYGLDKIEQIRAPIEQLLCIPFDHILTTNYSYEIERVADKRVKADGLFCKKLQDYNPPATKSETKYMLHTYNKIRFQGREHKIWHIHGEARKPDSVVLGHYYYGKLLGKYQDLLGRRGNKQLFRERAGEPPILSSWLDAFIMGDVYVLGFGYDFSEMDMWWLLNRKQREKASTGKLHYYTHREDDAAKLALMRAYGAEIEDLEYDTAPQDFRLFYQDAIADIRTKVLQKKDSSKTKTNK